MNTLTTEGLASGIRKNIVWIIIAGIAFMLVRMIVLEEQWLFILVFFVPVFLYLSLKKPFIFPFGIYAFLLPFDSVPVVGGSSLTKIVGVITVVAIGFTGLVQKKLHPLDLSALYWLGFIIFALLSVVWALDSDLVLKDVTTTFGIVALYLVIAIYGAEKKDFESLKLLVFFGGLAGCLVTIYGYEFGSLKESARRATLNMDEYGANPNTFAFSLLLPISVGVQMVIAHRRKYMKILFAGFLGLMLFTLIITGARGSMLAIATVFLVYIFSLKRKFGFAVFAAVLIILVVSMMPGFLAERWKNAVETGGAGRLDIWYIGLLAAKKYWLTGAGLNNFPLAYNEYAYSANAFKGLGRASHNVFLKVFVELGFLGFVLMCMALKRHYRILQRSFQEYNLDKLMLKAAFFGLLVESTFGDKIWNKSFWLLFMMIIIFRNFSFKRTAII